MKRGDKQPSVKRMKSTELIVTGPNRYQLVARLTDVSLHGDYGKAWGSDRQTIHDFSVEMDLEGPGLSIIAVSLSAFAHPYKGCPAVLSACQSLVGRSLVRGWRADVLERLGGTSGCTHVTTLLLGLAEARTMMFFMDINTSISSNPETHDDGRWAAVSLRRAPSTVNACHTLREGGPVVLLAQRFMAEGGAPPVAAESEGDG